MAWVRFTDNWSYRKPAFTIAYKRGWKGNIPHEAATLAIAAGRATRLRKTHKDEEPQEWPADKVLVPSTEGLRSRSAVI